MINLYTRHVRPERLVGTKRRNDPNCCNYETLRSLMKVIFLQRLPIRRYQLVWGAVICNMNWSYAVAGWRGSRLKWSSFLFVFLVATALCFYSHFSLCTLLNVMLKFRKYWYISQRSDNTKSTMLWIWLTGGRRSQSKPVD